MASHRDAPAAEEALAPEPVNGICLFLSHAGPEIDAARTLKAKIQQSPSARQAGLTVWLDKDDLEPGRDWQEQVEKAIATADAFAVYVGTADVTRWVTREVRLALSKAVDDPSFRFIPIFAEGSNARQDLPAFARAYHGIPDPLTDDDALRSLLAALTEQLPETLEIIDEPFVGPDAMTETEADLFFGRKEETQSLIGLCKRHDVVAVIADSGAGKSSLVQAGLIPEFYSGALEDRPTQAALQRDRVAIVMNPAGDPLERLKVGLTRTANRLGIGPDEVAGLRKRIDLKDPSESAFALRCDRDPETTDTLLVVDQFEELLTQTPTAKRQPFVDFLTALVDPAADRRIRIVLTIRADYANLLKRFPALHSRLAEENEAPRMRLRGVTGQGLQDVVIRPLRLGGCSEDDSAALLDLVRKDKQDQPGDLALVQVALWAAWRKHKEERRGLLECYAEIGGVQGALAHEAEKARDELSADEQNLLEPILMRLIRLGDTGGAVRRIASFDEFDQDKIALVRKLATKEFGRLLVAGDDTAQIAHESLIRQWEWLQDLADKNASESRLMMRLIDKASDWNAAASSDPVAEERVRNVRRILQRIFRGTVRDRLAAFPASLYDLEEFEALRQNRPNWLSDQERAFVDTGVAGREAQRRDEQLFTQTLRGLAGTFASATVVLLIAVAAIVYYVGLLAVAEEREKANANAALAALARTQHEQGNHVSAIKLALAALPRRNESNVAERLALVDTLRNSITGSGRILRHSLDALSAAFSPDGARIVTASDDKTARIWDAGTGTETFVLRGHVDRVLTAEFSPDGTQIVTTSDDKTARIWDAETGTEAAVLRGHDRPVMMAAFSPDGTRIVTASRDATARIWNAKSGTETAVLRGHDGSVLTAAFSPDGGRVVTAALDTAARIWDAKTGTEIAVLREHESFVQTAVFSSDGTRIVTASLDATARIWDAKTGAETFVLRGHESAVNTAVFSPDGTRIVTASVDTTARIWDAETGAETAVLRGHDEYPMSAAAFSPDGARIATMSYDNITRIWDARTGTETAVLRGQDDRAPTAASLPEGRPIVTVSPDSTARTSAQVPALKVILPHIFARVASTVTFSPNGARIVTASDDGTARVWELWGLSTRVVEHACSFLAERGATHLSDIEGDFKIVDLDPICTEDQRALLYPLTPQ